MKTITFETIESNENNQVLVYDVTFDENEIESLCQKLKTEVCYTVHFDYVAIHGPLDQKKLTYTSEKNLNSFLTFAISNLKKTPIEQNKEQDKEQDKEQGIISLTYRFEYDVHYYPYLHVLLEKMMDKDRNAFLEIMYPTFKNEYIPLRDEISRKEKQYLDLDEMNYYNVVDKKIKILDEIKGMLLKIKTGDYEIPVRKYYEEAQKMLIVKKRLVTENDVKKLRK